MGGFWCLGLPVDTHHLGAPLPTRVIAPGVRQCQASTDFMSGHLPVSTTVCAIHDKLP